MRRLAGGKKDDMQVPRGIGARRTVRIALSRFPNALSAEAYRRTRLLSRGWLGVGGGECGCRCKSPLRSRGNATQSRSCPRGRCRRSRGRSACALSRKVHRCGRSRSRKGRCHFLWGWVCLTCSVVVIVSLIGPASNKSNKASHILGGPATRIIEPKNGFFVSKFHPNRKSGGRIVPNGGTTTCATSVVGRVCLSTKDFCYRSVGCNCHCCCTAIIFFFIFLLWTRG